MMIKQTYVTYNHKVYPVSIDMIIPYLNIKKLEVCDQGCSCGYVCLTIIFICLFSIVNNSFNSQVQFAEKVKSSGILLVFGPT